MDARAEEKASYAEEIAKFEREKDDLRRLIERSRIQGDARLHRLLNGLIFAALAVLLAVQLVFHPMPDALSLELGIFMLSLKLIMMIEASSRFNHFQFWILHSIESRLLDLAERVDALDSRWPPSP